MDDIPWLYVAMIFIAFLSWVHNRIQEAKEHRRARAIEKEKAARARRTTAPPEFESPYRPPSPSRPSPESGGASAPKTFREVFEELQREFTEPELEIEEPPPSRLPVPPPLPAEPVYEQPVVPVGPIKIAPPLPGAKRLRSSRNTGTHLIRTLRHGGNLKTALILKEVLDKPRALRPRGVR